MKPKVYMLCGLPGSGKTTYAKKIEMNTQCVRLSLDERLISRYGKSFEASKYREYERNVEDELKKELKDAISNGVNVILDYGFWKKAKREEYRQIISQLNAEAETIYFKTDIRILKKRLKVRNLNKSDIDQYVSYDMLDNFAAEFEEPINEKNTVSVRID